MPTSGQQRSRRWKGTDEISLTQAVDAYCDSTIDSDDDAIGNTEEEADRGLTSETEEGHDEAYTTPQNLLFSGVFQGYVSLGKNSRYYAMGSKSGQSYVDLWYDPEEDSSWFDDMIIPLEVDDVAPYYPMQGSYLGFVR